MLSKIEINKNEFSENAWFIAIGVSEFISASISDIYSVDDTKFLELRVFDENHEIKYVRGSLKDEDEFQKRDSADICFGKSRKEEQYIDIDDRVTEKKNDGWIYATGGGKYRIKDIAFNAIEIEHYYKTDDKGFYKPFDFRIVRFLKKGDKFR